MVMRPFTTNHEDTMLDIDRLAKAIKAAGIDAKIADLIVPKLSAVKEVYDGLPPTEASAPKSTKAAPKAEGASS